MKTLLRSTFIVTASDSKDKELLLQNYFNLYDSGLSFDMDEDVPIWTFIQKFVQAHNHIPEVNTMRQHFVLRNEDQVIGRLDSLSSGPAVTAGDFITRLEDKAQDRRKRAVSEMLKDAATILTSGMTITQGKESKTLLGPHDAIKHVMDKAPEIVTPTLGSRLSGEVTRDGADFQREYERVEADPLAGIGQHSGLWQMDTALNGAKRFELWIHAAFTGHMKSTLMLNWAYNQAVWYKHSSLIFSLEMPYQQVRRLLYSLHSTHEKFKPIRFSLGLQTDPDATSGVPYANIRDGNLSEYHVNAKKFLYEYVIPDFNGTQVVDGINPNDGKPWGDPKNYGKIHIEVADPDKSDFTVADLRQRAELIYSKSPFKLIFVDHALLMAPRKWVSSTTDRLNEVIRDLKRLAMSFNRGQGIAVIALFQLSRDGFRSAQKVKEKTGTARYELVALSYANEAERSADVVTTSWKDDELANANRIQWQCLKSRDQKPFEIFQSRVEWNTRRLLTCMDMTMTTQQKRDIGDKFDAGELLDAL